MPSDRPLTVYRQPSCRRPSRRRTNSVEHSLLTAARTLPTRNRTPTIPERHIADRFLFADLLSNRALVYQNLAIAAAFPTPAVPSVAATTGIIEKPTHPIPALCLPDERNFGPIQQTRNLGMMAYLNSSDSVSAVSNKKEMKKQWQAVPIKDFTIKPKDKVQGKAAIKRPASATTIDHPCKAQKSEANSGKKINPPNSTTDFTSGTMIKHAASREHPIMISDDEDGRERKKPKFKVEQDCSLGELARVEIERTQELHQLRQDLKNATASIENMRGLLESKNDELVRLQHENQSMEHVRNDGVIAELAALKKLHEKTKAKNAETVQCLIQQLAKADSHEPKPGSHLGPTLSTAKSSLAIDEKRKLDNIRKTYAKVKRHFDILQPIAVDISRCTKSMHLSSFGEFGRYLKQLTTALEQEREERQAVVVSAPRGNDTWT